MSFCRICFIILWYS